jgi:hypothetical protein
MGNVNMYLIEFVYSISPSIRAVKKDIAIIPFMRKENPVLQSSRCEIF